MYNSDLEAEHYYFSGRTKRWHKVGSGDEDFGDEPISSTFSIMARGGGGEVIINPPPVLRRSKTKSKRASPVDPPPVPYIYTLLQNDDQGDPYFYALWYAHNFKVRYNTEIVNPFSSNSWVTVHSQTSSFELENPQVLWTQAGIRGSGLGVGRVVAEWDYPPSKKFRK